MVDYQVVGYAAYPGQELAVVHILALLDGDYGFDERFLKKVVGNASLFYDG